MAFEASRRGAFLVEGFPDAGFRRTTRYQVREAGEVLGWPRFEGALRTEPDLRAALAEALARSPLEAFFWECQPRPADGDGPFAFVLVEAPALAALEPDASAFAEQLRAAEGVAAVFPNLGGDAQLVSPRPMADPATYPHLARFVRDAPPEQIDGTFAALGEAIADWGRGRLWVSTSGLGVPWVHLRLDRRPKYYVYAPFRR